MFTSSNNKNPLINCERKQPKNKKFQNPIGPKISLKCMKMKLNQKRKGRMVLSVLEDKKT